MAARAALRPLQRYGRRAGGGRRFRLLLHHATGHSFDLHQALLARPQNTRKPLNIGGGQNRVLVFGI